MVKVLIICNLGVSTNMLKQKLESAFADRDEEVTLLAQPRADLDDLVDDIDLVLIAPQISFLKEEIEEICEAHHKKAIVIPFKLYGGMDGNGVADLVLKEVRG